MEDVTLATARTIARAIASLEGAPDLDAIIQHVEKTTVHDRADALSVIQFLQDLNTYGDMTIHEPSIEHDFKSLLATSLARPMNMGNELHYNYAVAKALLEQIIHRTGVPDSEEIRKTLREIARFMDAMLKMQEKVFNLQQMQKFQETVLQIIENVDPVAKEMIVSRLQETDL